MLTAEQAFDQIRKERQANPFIDEIRAELLLDLPQETKSKLRSLLAKFGTKKFYTRVVIVAANKAVKA